MAKGANGGGANGDGVSGSMGRLSDNIEQPARSFYANSKVE